MSRRWIVPLALAGFVIQSGLLPSGPALAQGAFPAPLPSQMTNDPAFPPVNGAPSASFGSTRSPFPATGAAPIPGAGFGAPQAGPPPGDDQCMKGFMVLRQDAEKRGAAIKAASERHAPPEEACKLIGRFSAAESKMVKYVEANSQKCGIPAQIAQQLRTGHKNTEAMQRKVCNVAQQQQQRGPAGPSLSELLGSSAAVPEANVSTKRGAGTTFDTLNGNVLTR
ncbi:MULTISPECIES: hypothetical protein [Rhodopseudomonas]|uniref:Signal peptide protein n=1 Tax=Rhodopseudomonas palustris TaxID=1076 RepID=A0A0D7EN85_RHOPL|nr:signal peptide protein [Rhodopseudomonas palustris]